MLLCVGCVCQDLIVVFFLEICLIKKMEDTFMSHLQSLVISQISIIIKTQIFFVLILFVPMDQVLGLLILLHAFINTKDIFVHLCFLEKWKFYRVVLLLE